MALPSRPAGSIRRPLVITWEDLTLTGATITGTLQPMGGVVRPIVGALVTVNSTQFSWQPAAGDVVAGNYKVQFVATFPSGATPEKSTVEEWVVEESI